MTSASCKSGGSLKVLRDEASGCRACREYQRFVDDLKIAAAQLKKSAPAA
jgi:hypothetical protein